MHADAWPQRALLAVSLMDAWHSPGSDCSGESQGALSPANVSGYIGALSVPCLHRGVDVANVGLPSSGRGEQTFVPSSGRGE